MFFKQLYGESESKLVRVLSSYRQSLSFYFISFHFIHSRSFFVGYEEHTVAVADKGVTAICWRLRPSRFRRKMMTPTTPTMTAITVKVPKIEILKREEDNGDFKSF